MSKHQKIPPMKGMAPAVDLASISQPTTPGSLEIELVMRYAMNCYTDVNDAVPFLGIIDTDSGTGPPAISFTDEKGVNRFYMLAPNTREILQQFLGIAGLHAAINAAKTIAAGLIDDPEIVWQADAKAKLDEIVLLLTDGVPTDETVIEDSSS